MRSLVLRDRRKVWSYTASILVLSVVVAGCSTDFDRFSRSALPTAAETSAADQSNPYPAGVDPTTTASLNKRVVPVGGIGEGALAATPQGVYHNPEPMYVASAQSAPTRTYRNPYPANTQPAVTQKTDLPSPIKLGAPQAQPVSYQTTASVPPQTQAVAPQVQYQQNTGAETPATPSVGSINDNAATAPTTPQASYVPPQTAQAPIAPVADSTQTNPGGWSEGNATRYQVKPGETLYNLSKRFGVPVSALMTANSIEDSNDIQAGQIISIPNFHYAETAPISAPDANPNTRAARASTGLLGEANPWQNIVPTRRPVQTASLDANRYQTSDNTQKAISPGQVNPVLQTTPSLGKHKVRPGDSLSMIAAANDVTTAQLRQANGLSGDTIRVGQTLNIPAVTSNQIASAGKTQIPQGVSPVTTGSVNKQEKPSTQKTVEKPKSKPDVASKKAPESSGISQFRWPVKGRVVTRYGEKDGSKTNDGIDISVPEGTAVRSTENGVVIYAGNDIEAYGNLLLVRHDNDWVSAYAHNKSFDVKRGDSIRRGQIIARSGRTGHAKQPKLHFELRKNSEPVNPLQHLSRI